MRTSRYPTATLFVAGLAASFLPASYAAVAVRLALAAAVLPAVGNVWRPLRRERSWMAVLLLLLFCYLVSSAAVIAFYRPSSDLRDDMIRDALRQFFLLAVGAVLP